jgi:hypothetical protein
MANGHTLVVTRLSKPVRTVLGIAGLLDVLTRPTLPQPEGATDDDGVSE